MRNTQKGFVVPALLVVIALLVVGGGVYVYEKSKSSVNTSEAVSFKNYNKDNFIPYTQARYYSVNYPKGWVVYQVSGQDTSADSLLLVPQNIASKSIKVPPEKMLSGSEAYTIKEVVKKDKQQAIEVGAGFQYSGYVPPEDHARYLKSVVQLSEKRSKEAGLSSKSQVVTFRGEPRIYSVADWTENNITTKYVSLLWFAKSDPQGRDKGAAPVLIGVTYMASPENFSEETFNGVVDSVDEHFWEVNFDARSDKKPEDTTKSVNDTQPTITPKVNIDSKIPASSPTTVTKTDLYLQDIGAFTYLDWTYKTYDKGTFMGKTRLYDYNAQSHAVGYTLSGADIVSYFAGFVQFASAEEAKTLFTNLLADTNSVPYSNTYQSVYKIVDANNNMIMWLHNNVLVYVNANPASPRLDEFLNSTFNIYVKKFPPK